MKTTLKQFELFKREFKKYYKLLNLSRYYIYFDHCEIGDADGTCTTNISGRIATVALSNNDDEIRATDDEIKKIAKHEALELFLAEFWQLAQNRYIREEELEKERHSVIRTLEQIV